MSQSYRVVYGTFWTGRTGRQIRTLGADAWTVAAYVMTSPHANMIGLYYLPLSYIITDTGLTTARIEKALADLSALDFLRYDKDAEWVWVCTAVVHQCKKLSTPQMKGAIALYADATPTPMLRRLFWERYHPTLPDLPEPLPYPIDRVSVGYSEVADTLSGSGSGSGSGTGEGTGSRTEPSAPSALAVRFESFWQVYPKKVGKKAAERAWAKVHPSEALTETILNAIAKQRKSPGWLKDGGQFIPNPTTWLNQGRWDDEVQAVSVVPAARSSARTTGNMAALQTVLDRSKGGEVIDGLFTQKRLCAGDGGAR